MQGVVPVAGSRRCDEKQETYNGRGGLETSFKFRPRGCCWRDGLQGAETVSWQFAGRTDAASFLLEFRRRSFCPCSRYCETNVFPPGTEIHSLYALVRDVQPTRRKRYEYAESTWIFQRL